MTTDRFETRDTRTRLAVIDNEMFHFRRELGELKSQVSDVDGKLDTLLQRSAPPKSDSEKPGLSISNRTLKFMAPLAVAFGAGLATIVKMLIETLSGRPPTP